MHINVCGLDSCVKWRVQEKHVRMKDIGEPMQPTPHDRQGT